MPDNTKALIALLNRAMSMEYGALFLLPTYIAQVQDEELKRQLRLIEEMELEHAEKTAQMIFSLGGTPNADLPQLRPRSGVRAILESQIQAEKDAIEIYARGAGLCQDAAMRDSFTQLRKDEEGHLALLERSLARLGPAA